MPLNKSENQNKAFTREAAEIRRQQLIEACARVLSEHGAAGISVRAICKEAGVSPGLLTHHFGTIAAILAETYRWIGAEISAAMEASVHAAAPNPKDRLFAFLSASFQPKIASADMLSCYVAFWTLTRGDTEIAAIRAELAKAYQTRLSELLDDMGLGHPHTAAALGALIDGLWLELSMDTAIITPPDAEAIVAEWLAKLTA